MFDQADSFVTADGRTIGAVMMEMKNITLRFGGVVAIKDISFDVREGEIRAIIGPMALENPQCSMSFLVFTIPKRGRFGIKVRAGRK